MAKAKENETAVPPVSDEDIALVQRAVMDITGFGELAAVDRVKQMSAKTVAKIAQLERDDRRVEIVTLLYS
jgi:hypothetical protein